MNRKMYWGIAALILFIGAFGFLLYRQHVDIQQLKKEAAQAEKLLEEKNMPIVENNDRPARPGYKLVPHDDHFHEVPLSAPDTWQEEPHEPVQVQQNEVSNVEINPAPEMPKYTGELTYEAYERYVTEAFQNIKRNEFGLPISPLPAPPPSFQNPEEVDKANRLWNKLSAEYDKSIIAAAIRMDARYVAPEYTGELTYEAYHKYLAERKKLKEANNE